MKKLFITATIITILLVFPIQAKADTFGTVPIPPDFLVTGFGSSEVYRGQTFRLPFADAAFANSLTVFVGPTTDFTANFHVLLTEVDMTDDFHPTNVLFESGTLWVAQQFTPSVRRGGDRRKEE